MKETVKMQLEARELAAIKKLMLGDEGINITSLVEDLCPNPESKDMVSVKVACHLSGLMPKFEPIHGFYKDYNDIYEVEVMSESTILGVCKIKQTKKWHKNYEDTCFKEVSDFKETIRQESITIEKEVVQELGDLNVKIEETKKELPTQANP